jgi:CDP-glycerol glycerophosphotransferase (TagB/SpsB family)
MRRLVLLARIWLVRAVHAVATLLPVEDRIVLATAMSPVLRGNLAAIHAELRGRRPRPRIVVIASRRRRGARGLLDAVALSARGAYYLATSRLFVVDDYFFPIYVVTRRPGTTVVQTWHASGAFKRMGWSLEGRSFGGGRALRERVPIHANYDVCLVSAQRFVPAYAEAFRQPPERFVCDIGIPSTDVLFNDEAAGVSGRIRERLAIAPGRTVVLYAPTFRGDSGVDPDSGALLDLAELRRAIGDTHVVLVRFHPFVRRRLVLDGLDGFVVDVSDEPAIEELMLASDALVTDYSSTIFEFSRLGRPIVLFAPDLAAYERQRGFYFDYRSGVPGPVLETSRAVADCLRDGSFDLDRVREFGRQAFDVADGRAAARFVDRFATPLPGGTGQLRS